LTHILFYWILRGNFIELIDLNRFAFYNLKKTSDSNAAETDLLINKDNNSFKSNDQNLQKQDNVIVLMDDFSLKSDSSSMSDRSFSSKNFPSLNEINSHNNKSERKLKRKQMNIINQNQHSHNHHQSQFKKTQDLNHETTITSIYKNNNNSIRSNKSKTRNNNQQTVKKFNFVTVTSNEIDENSRVKSAATATNNSTSCSASSSILPKSISNNQKTRPLNADSYSTDSSSLLVANSVSNEQDNHHDTLVNTIKNLTIKQKERVYSASGTYFLLL
jgi:hypothetical protein